MFYTYLILNRISNIPYILAHYTFLILINMEEERHSSSEDPQMDMPVLTEEIRKEKRTRISYIRDVCDLPQTKMRALLKAAFPEFNIEEDALIALTKAAVSFPDF